MAVKIEDEKFTTYINTGDHNLVADEPLDLQGQNMGPTPYQLLMSSLGACTAMTLRMYANFKKIPLEAVEVNLSHAKEHADDSMEIIEGKEYPIDVFERDIKLIG